MYRSGTGPGPRWLAPGDPARRPRGRNERARGTAGLAGGAGIALDWRVQIPPPDLLSPGAAVSLLVVEVVAIAFLARTASGARLGVALAVAGLGIPFVVSGSRGVLAVGFLMCVFRSLDLRQSQLPSFQKRLLHMVAILDTRRVERSAPALDASAALDAAVSGSITVLSLWLATAARSSFVVSALALGVAVFAAFEFMDRTVRVVGARAGWTLPRISRKAHAAASLTEFWGTRWNVVISDILREHVFAPRGRTPRLALTLAFLASALAHFYLVAPGTGLVPAISMAGFFLVQPPLIAAERALRVRRWSPGARRAWTLGMLALFFPLFAEPALRLIGLR